MKTPVIPQHSRTSSRRKRDRQPTPKKLEQDQHQSISQVLIVFCVEIVYEILLLNFMLFQENSTSKRAGAQDGSCSSAGVQDGSCSGAGVPQRPEAQPMDEEAVRPNRNRPTPLKSFDEAKAKFSRISSECFCLFI